MDTIRRFARKCLPNTIRLYKIFRAQLLLDCCKNPSVPGAHIAGQERQPCDNRYVNFSIPLFGVHLHIFAANSFTWHHNSIEAERIFRSLLRRNIYFLVFIYGHVLLPIRQLGTGSGSCHLQADCDDKKLRKMNRSDSQTDEK